jgi:hypothetical protein
MPLERDIARNDRDSILESKSDPVFLRSQNLVKFHEFKQIQAQVHLRGE